MSDEGNLALSTNDCGKLTAHLHDATIRQITELAQVQVELRKWYSAKPNKPSQQLEPEECPALVRVMQIIRLLRESQMEFELELNQAQD